ncbi:phosphatidate cytidylyltransferase [Kallipyga massiliensis]|uniref:phosphatidate cytidylyltransferase n=1 Tax=Kallipyga massiliensis TaxID=1472764 RepID=UPI0004B96B22|nr:phosphatidate cytidylyltransferase [Kallipyga massiliensis]
MKNFLSRLAVGAGILLFILLMIFSANRLVLFIGMEIITFICLEEVFHALDPKRSSPFRIWGQVLNLFANVTAFLSNLYLYMAVWALAIVLLFILSIFRIQKGLKDIMEVLFSTIYISFLFCFVYFFPNDRQTYLFFIFLIAWGTDSFAYLVGSWIGRTPLTRISPHKTWEGSIGGMVGAMALCGIGSFFYQGLSLIPMLVIGAIGSIIAQLGDIFASSLKRKTGIKDFSHILRSHGGFLDRFDSVVFTIPYIWLIFVFYIF